MAQDDGCNTLSQNKLCRSRYLWRNVVFWKGTAGRYVTCMLFISRQN